MAQSIFTSQTPTTADSNSPAGQRVLGTVFTADVPGHVTGIRWYAPSVAPSGNPIGSLWLPAAGNPAASTATLLGSKTFGPLTLGAWNTALLDTPLAVTAGTPYGAVVWTPDHYCFSAPDPWPIVNGPLRAYSSAEAGNSRFENGAGSGAYPANGSAGYNFFVDLLFEPAPRATTTIAFGGGYSRTVTGRTAGPASKAPAGASGRAATTTVRAVTAHAYAAGAARATAGRRAGGGGHGVGGAHSRAVPAVTRLVTARAPAGAAGRAAPPAPVAPATAAAMVATSNLPLIVATSKLP